MLDFRNIGHSTFWRSKFWPSPVYFLALSTKFFIFYFSYSRHIGFSRFKRSLIFKYKTSAILLFYFSKFWPSPLKLLLGEGQNFNEQIVKSHCQVFFRKTKLPSSSFWTRYFSLYFFFTYIGLKLFKTKIIMNSNNFRLHIIKS